MDGNRIDYGAYETKISAQQKKTIPVAAFPKLEDLISVYNTSSQKGLWLGSNPIQWLKLPIICSQLTYLAFEKISTKLDETK